MISHGASILGLGYNLNVYKPLNSFNQIHDPISHCAPKPDISTPRVNAPYWDPLTKYGLAEEPFRHATNKRGDLNIENNTPLPCTVVSHYDGEED